MPPKSVTLAAFLPAQLKSSEQGPEPAQIPSGQPRPQRCRCEGPFDLCWRYPATIPNALCKPTWDRLLAPFQFKGREWTIVELRSLWPHTVQALNERLMKGRMERTLKDDLQDDLQVLVDLIQYSCKPHPRPPRAGMKTLIVQGRILAEAIAQDALFQLDPADPSAPRPDRDLVDLINRLRDHHPHSLLAPALHVLRTLGNTAVHLDRDSARLADGEIGDAAAVCCRLVLLVVDAYMHMCANLHRHEETQEALAQPLEEAPVAPIPVPNVLLRQRDPSPASAGALTPGTATAAAAATAASPVAPPAAALPPPTAALAPPRAAVHVVQPERVLLGRTAGTKGGGGGAVDGGGDDDELPAPPSGGDGVAAAASGTHRRSSGSGGGGRRSCVDSADGSGRVPYSLVSCDWSAAAAAGQHPPHAPAADSDATSPVEPTLTQPRRSSPSGSRGWWPRVSMSEAPVAPLLPTPTTLLRRTETGGGAGTQGSQSGPSREAEPPAAAAAARALQPPTASSVSNWVQGHPVPYGLPGACWSAPASGGSSSGGGGSGGGAAAIPTTHFGRLSSSSSSGGGGGGAGGSSTSAHNPTALYILAGGAACASASAGSASAAVVATAGAAAGFTQLPTGQTDPWAGGGLLYGTAPLHPAGSSPRRYPRHTAHSDVSGNPHGNDNGYPTDPLHTTFSSRGTPTRGGSPPPSRRGQSPPRQPAPTPLPPDGQQQQQPSQRQTQRPFVQQQQHPNGAHGLGPGGDGGGPGSGSVSGSVSGSGSGPGLGSVPGVSEASKRLLQLCTSAQAPPAARVERLLQAGASLGFTDKSGMTALHLACYWPHEGAARLMVAAQPSAAGTSDREGRTPLWVAAQRGHTGLADMLLTELPEGAAQVDVANAAGVTPLRVAAAQGHVRVVEALLQAGANVEAADKDGFTPLYVASARCQLEVVRLLLGAGATPDRADRGGRTPLWAALHPGGAAKAEAPPERRAGVVRLLLGAGADVYLLSDSRDRDYCWQLLAQSIAEGE